MSNLKTMNSYQRVEHAPGCDCSVCWTASFCDQMHARNEARQKRVHEILNNPFGSVRRPSFWTLERHEKGTPFVPMIHTNQTEGH